MDDKKIEVSVSLMNAILGYLGTRPAQETYNLIYSINEQVSSQMQDPKESE